MMLTLHIDASHVERIEALAMGAAVMLLGTAKDAESINRAHEDVAACECFTHALTEGINQWES